MKYIHVNDDVNYYLDILENFDHLSCSSRGSHCRLSDKGKFPLISDKLAL